MLVMAEAISSESPQRCGAGGGGGGVAHIDRASGPPGVPGDLFLRCGRRLLSLASGTRTCCGHTFEHIGLKGVGTHRRCPNSVFALSLELQPETMVPRQNR